MRWATLVAVAVVLSGACTDLREFRGSWVGPRIGEVASVRVGGPGVTTARLEIDQLDRQGLRGSLTLGGSVTAVPLVSLPGAEADALAGMTFIGQPARVYLAFVELTDGGGEALTMVALYDDQRIELRVLRGGTTPLYAIFALREAP